VRLALPVPVLLLVLAPAQVPALVQAFVQAPAKAPELGPEQELGRAPVSVSVARAAGLAQEFAAPQVPVAQEAQPAPPALARPAATFV
jgi:hypothetical protein